MASLEIENAKLARPGGAGRRQRIRSEGAKVFMGGNEYRTSRMASRTFFGRHCCSFAALITEIPAKDLRSVALQEKINHLETCRNNSGIKEHMRGE